MSAPSTLPFGIAAIDRRLIHGGLEGSSLHDVTAASTSLVDDCAATLFTAGIVGRLSEIVRGQVLWVVTDFDLYAPRMEEAGLVFERTLIEQCRGDREVLALMEEGLRDGGLAAVVGEVRMVSLAATRRLTAAAASGRTPAFLLRRRRRKDACPFEDPSAAYTRWRIGCEPSRSARVVEVGRSGWSVELVHQSNGLPFSVSMGRCDRSGRLVAPVGIDDVA